MKHEVQLNINHKKKKSTNSNCTTIQHLNPIPYSINKYVKNQEKSQKRNGRTLIRELSFKLEILK